MRSSSASPFIDTADSYGPHVSEQLIYESLHPFHRPDPAVPPEDSVGALVTLKEQGKIRHIGLSNVTEDQVRRAQRLTPVVSILPWAPIQNLDRNRIVREMAQRYDATPRQIVLAWLLARSPPILPILGTGTVSHLNDNVAAAAITLAPADVAALTGNQRSR